MPRPNRCILALWNRAPNQRAKRVLRHILRGENAAARRMGARFMAASKTVVRRPRILVVGGGTLGSGAETLYDDPGVTLVGRDVFASPLTVVVDMPAYYEIGGGA